MGTGFLPERAAETTFFDSRLTLSYNAAEKAESTARRSPADGIITNGHNSCTQGDFMKMQRAPWRGI